MNSTADQLIQRLYQEAKRLSPTHFQEWAMQQVQALIPFDSGIWGDGVGVGRIHSLFLYKQPPEMVDNYSKLLMSGMEDDLSAHIITHPGTAITQLDFYSDWYSTDWYRKHCRQFGMEHACAIAFFKQRLELFTSIAYYRNDPANPFTDEEKRLKEIVDPHLRESYELCLLFHLYKETSNSGGEWEQQSIALADNDGYIYYCNDNFIRQLEPLDLARNAIFQPLMWQQLKQQGRLIINDARLLTSELSNDQWLIQVQQAEPIQLTETEKLIATGLAAGQSYKELALEHNKAVSTVKNQASAIYKKLRINGKDELPGLLSGARFQEPANVE